MQARNKTQSGMRRHFFPLWKPDNIISIAAIYSDYIVLNENRIEYAIELNIYTTTESQKIISFVV